MNKKGFTIIEILAVIVILGILATIASIEFSGYKKRVNEEEKKQLRSTIEVCYDNYRKDNDNYKSDISFSTDSDIFNYYFNELSYNGKIIKYEDVQNFRIVYHIKGELLNSECYLSGRVKDRNNPENEYIKDNICAIDKNGQCLKENGKYVASRDGVLCINFSLKPNKVLMQDSEDNKNSRANLCYYLVHKDEICQPYQDPENNDDEQDLENNDDEQDTESNDDDEFEEE